MFGENEDSTYSILYLPKEKSFKFCWSDTYTEEGENFNIDDSIEFKLSVTGFDYCTAELVDCYYEYGNIEASFSADIIFNTASYNSDSTTPTIKIKSNTYEFSDAKAKEYANSDFKLAMTLWNNLLYKELGMTLNDFGFKNY
jgi:hypothetical protein